MSAPVVATPPPPQVRLSLGVTGHRAGHQSFADNEAQIAAVLESVLELIDQAVRSAPGAAAFAPLAPTRVHTLLADGTDRMAARLTLTRGYELAAPLPFGRRLNKAINSLTTDPAEARRLLAGDDALEGHTQAHAQAIRELTDRSRVFGLAEQDERIASLFLAKLDAPDDLAAAQLFNAESSRRVALAGRILIEQSDLVIGVWDGVTTAHVGGTGHTLATALELGAPVLWIDPAAPTDWRLLHAPEALASIRCQANGDEREAALTAAIHAALDPGTDPENPGFTALEHESWRPHSSPLAHGYRRVEALFGGGGLAQRFASLKQRYEEPDAFAQGSGAAFLASVRYLPDADATMADGIANEVMRRFAWADGVSAHLSDAYRGGMTINFLLSSLSIVGGIAYLPFVGPEQKWIFALFELLLLCGVLAITALGQRYAWHKRWFETRRVAEYLRHSPLLLVLGAARPAGRWPHGADASWPEFYARQILRSLGLPRMAITGDYLHGVLTGPLAEHVRSQRDYHFAKAQRLATVHRGLDHLSERLFQCAVATVTLYLNLRAIEMAHLMPDVVVGNLSKVFTVLAVMFPTFGAGVAGIRYFGDFERFGEISEVTAEKLDAIHRRITLLAEASPGELSYGQVAELAHATDDVVVAEIESWQAVFGGKLIAVPV